MAPVVGPACVLRLRALSKGDELEDRSMLVTKKEHRVESVNGEHTRLDNIGLFVGSALDIFRGRFRFLTPATDSESDNLRRIQPKGDSQG
jgi:hypothetical protein